jgi:hypothetical protein
MRPGGQDPRLLGVVVQLQLAELAGEFGRTGGDRGHPTAGREVRA